MSTEILWGELIASIIIISANWSEGKPAPVDSPMAKVKITKAIVRVVVGFIFIRAAVALLIYYLP